MFGEQDNQEDMDWLWVDFVEDEVDPELKDDLKRLMRLSGDQCQHVENLFWTKEMVKSIDPAHEDYLKNWNKKASISRIMDACDKIQRDQWIEKNWSKKVKWLQPERK